MNRADSMKSVVAVVLCTALSVVLAKSGAAQQAPLAPEAQTAIDATQTQAIPNSVADERYRIGSGDVLEIRVFERPQLSREAMRVDGSGRIRMPLIQEELVAACQTEFGL